MKTKFAVAFTAVLLAAALLVPARSADAGACGWCGFMPPYPCNYRWGTGFYCFHGFFNDCYMIESEFCTAGEQQKVQSYQATVEKWKTHAPRIYAKEAAQVISEWRGPKPIQYHMLSRFKVDRFVADPVVAEAVQQPTHYDAMRTLARAGLLDGDPELKAELLK